MDISVTLIKTLRKQTGAGIMDCKKALIVADGDIDKAIEVLIEKELVPITKRRIHIIDEDDKKFIENCFFVRNQIEELTKKEVCYINLSRDNCSIFDSKFNGIPYCPKNKILPVDINGNQLVFLAQINFAQVPAMKNYPQSGILQFFICNDLSICQSETEQINFKVIYYKDIDYTLDENDVKYKLIKPEEIPVPFLDENALKMNFSLRMEGMTFDDYRCYNLMEKIYNQHFKDDFSYERYIKLIDDEDYGNGCKIGGYPVFRQNDPREWESENLEDYDTLLFQIAATDDYLYWYDNGVANFFINSEMLKKCIFDKILFDWACY